MLPVVHAAVTVLATLLLDPVAVAAYGVENAQ
jgi:hypothetical protein